MPEYKNQFVRPDHYEYEIQNDAGKKLGSLRLKPSSVLWKPASQQKYFSVPLDAFATWITSEETGARRTKS